MSDGECWFAGVLTVTIGMFFGGLIYSAHQENMACIKAGGTMKERACQFMKPTTEKDQGEVK